MSSELIRITLNWIASFKQIVSKETQEIINIITFNKQLSIHLIIQVIKLIEGLISINIGKILKYKQHMNCSNL